MKRFLVVSAHPLKDSLCGHLTALVTEQIAASPNTLQFFDLYQRDFDPRLSPEERQSYYASEYAGSAVGEDAVALQAADVLILIFPTWWFGLPAILKGWIDRVFVPGTAYDHAPDFGRMLPRLNNMKNCIVVTTLGSPWWIDRLVMLRPVRRILKTAVIGTCAPKARFTMLSLYNCESLSPVRLAVFEQRIGQAIQQTLQ
ncbi:NAD(P)H-dependent oxidoreductase [Phyllobacterium sp. 628]|uniref:NAD(P)H-dependent oxidoreductase n=1 Tax=Phyllobacterium sp. 628 TaxID=2718938 RepID=UPI0016626018|nr:NAD(P)H-dependent oxidoreductase [Phyllobacterium sp. 628]QND53988.1 NAD(P)H-dependent oxidoreductase [Phyllobacterium sp. 628]